jgi:hypothetical protein
MACEPEEISVVIKQQAPLEVDPDVGADSRGGALLTGLSAERRDELGGVGE